MTTLSTTNLTLTMPRLGETMEEGVIVGWLVEPGQQFRRGDAILELETDKTVVEYPALGDGRLDGTLVSAGDRVPVGAPIARVAVLSADEWAAALPDTALPDPAEAEAEAAPAAAASAALPPPASATAGTPAPERSSDDRLRATPTARRLARQRGVALETLHGSGRRGRIERADVENAAGSNGPAPADLRWLDTPAGRLAYAQAGSAGPVHLLVHGFAGDRTAWANLASGLARSGKRVVMPDLPGHGATAIEATDVDGLAAAVTALAESLPGPLVLVGHSLGAAAAVHAARRLGDRVARLVLLTPAGCGPRIGAEFVHGMAAAETTGEVSHLLRLLGPRGGQLSDAALAAMAREMGRGRLRTLATALATPDGRQRIDLLRPLAELAERIPVRAIFGLDDRIVSATDALNLPPRVAAHFLPSGHMPQWDAPREVATLIDEETQHG
ncbi:acetoin dehydrogenase dihydrolipoyllysine-residue acetyltransferase subunit [Azospirillum melinis]|uniref:acetoin dehydrogenase dihydrolipoyllysine-residue acetyltransferase subunit n=1 Tax=Azospirillum melinis TaxID=328839 RepID=UPI0037567217